MTESEFDTLFRLLCKLQTQHAPCHNGGCVGYCLCEFCVYGAYGSVCAIDVVREQAETEYNKQYKK